MQHQTLLRLGQLAEFGRLLATVPACSTVPVAGRLFFGGHHESAGPRYLRTASRTSSRLDPRCHAKSVRRQRGGGAASAAATGSDTMPASGGSVGSSAEVSQARAGATT